MPNDLRGKVAIVTGAGGGIGRATCVALSEAGVQVIASGRDPDPLDRTVRATTHCLRPAIPVSDVDVTDEHSVRRLTATTLETFGRIDVLVTAAGAPRTSIPRPVSALDTDDWDGVVDVNLKGVFLTNRAVLPAMRRQREGQIVNISSARGALAGRSHAAAYCASKFGVTGLSQALADEVRDDGIRVYVLLPDAVNTALIAGTRLAPRGALRPEVVGRLIVDLLQMPFDTIVVNPLVAPFSATEAFL